VTAELSAYAALFASALVAATLFPASSEAVLVGLLVSGTGDPWWLVAVATLGNTLGGVVNWVCGRALAAQRHRRWFPISSDELERAAGWFQRFGLPALLFTWLPVVGDALTVVAGMLQVPLGRFVALVGLGKGLRYAALAAATLASLGTG
jgi:membrane protein YqaA with SNARE-associated domain